MLLPRWVTPFGETMRQRAVVLSGLLAIVAAACGGDGKITDPKSAAQLGPVSAIGTDPATGARIETNQDDYMPGEKVHVNGSGWAPGEVVHLNMTEEPNTHEDISMDVEADGNG